MSVVANVALNLDTRGVPQKLRDVQNQAQQTERAFDSLGNTVGRLVKVYAAFQAVKFVFTQAAEIESQARSLQVLTGSAQKATQIIKQLQDLGAATPFTSAELIDAAKRLQAFGVATDNVVETTRRLADVSGATGAELQGLVTAYGQVQAKGRLQGEELLQFQERGVALQKVLKEEYKLSGDQFQKALEKGQIGAASVEYAIKKLTDAGGKYANGAIAQSDTLNGKLSTLQDSFQRLAQNIGKFFEPVFKFLIDGVNALLERLNNAQRIGVEAQAYQEANKRTQMRFGPRAANPLDQEVQQYRERLRKSLVTAGMGAGAAPKAPSISAGAPPSLLAPSAGKGGADKAAQEAKRLAEQIASQKAAAAELLATEKGRLTVAQTAEPLQRLITEAIVQQNDIQRQYADKLRESKSAEETLNLQIAERNALQTNALELQRALSEETDRIVDPLKQLTDASAERLQFENKYQELLSQGVNPELAKEFAQLELTAEKQTQILTLRLAELEGAKAKLQAESDVAKALQEQIDKIKEIMRLQGQAVAQSKQESEDEKKKREKRERQDQDSQNRAERLKNLYRGVVNTIEDGIVDAIQVGIDGLINGTKELDQALKEIAAGVLQDIGKQLVRFGVNMLMRGVFPGAFANGGVFASNGIQAFASGGIINKPTLFPFAQGGTTRTGLMGEAGPEAIMPLQRNSNGRLGVDASGLREAMGTAGGSAGAPVLNMSFETTSIGGVEYVSRDQLEAAMAETRRQATRDGAKRGMSMTLDRIQQSPQTRSRIGIR